MLQLYQQGLAASRDSAELARITRKLCRPQAGWDTNSQAASPLSPACLCPIFRCYTQFEFCFMKKWIFCAVLTIICLCIYFLFFSITYEALVPYYYEEYLDTLFLGGVFIIVFLPTLISQIGNFIGKSISYVRASIFTNCAIIFLCFSSLVYMYIGSPEVQNGSGNYYKVVPVDG